MSPIWRRGWGFSSEQRNGNPWPLGAQIFMGGSEEKAGKDRSSVPVLKFLNGRESLTKERPYFSKTLKEVVEESHADGECIPGEGAERPDARRC